MPIPNYSPAAGFGTVSTDGQYKFTQSGWISNVAPAPSPVPVPKPAPSPTPTPTPVPVVAPVAPSGTEVAGELGNLRVALRAALNEASQRRVESNFKAVAPLGTSTPGTIGSIVDMIRGGIKSPVETTFSDIITGFREATDAKQKEQDRINELREEYGSAVPSNVKDLATALDLIAPTVDKERRLKLTKMASDQAEDNDIESWAESFAKGEITIGNVPAKIRTAVKVRSDTIRTKLEGEAKEEYKSRIAFRLEKKSSDFETERTLTIQDDNLNVQEQRDVIDYIDGLEAAQKASKAKGNKGFFSFTNPPVDQNQTTIPAPVTPAFPFGPTNPASQSPIGSLKPFNDAFVQPFRDIFKTPSR